MVINGQFGIHKFMSSCLHQISLGKAPKHAQENFTNVINNQVVVVGQAEPPDLLCEESAWEQRLHHQFSMYCRSEAAVVVAINLENLAKIIPEIGEKLSEKYLSRYQTRIEVFWKVIDKFNLQTAESNEIFHGHSLQSDTLPRPEDIPQRSINRVCRINSLKGTLSDFYNRYMEPLKTSVAAGSLTEFQIDPSKQRQPTLHPRKPDFFPSKSHYTITLNHLRQKIGKENAEKIRQQLSSHHPEVSLKALPPN